MTHSEQQNVQSDDYIIPANKVWLIEQLITLMDRSEYALTVEPDTPRTEIVECFATAAGHLKGIRASVRRVSEGK